MNNKDLFTQQLLDIEAIKINTKSPYTWASGWKSPIYCDNRKILGYPAIRENAVIQLTELIKTHFSAEDMDNIVFAGVATAGIAIGILIAEQFHAPFCYVRSKPKEHGMGNQIEGIIPINKNVIVIEDLISTGKSSLQVVEVLREAQANVIGMYGLFTYEFDIATQAFINANVPLFTLSNYSTLLALCKTQDLFAPEIENSLQQWRLNPADWQG